MKHEFNLLIQIDSFLSDNFPGCKNSYQVKKKFGKYCSSIFRQLKNIEHNLRSGVCDVELNIIEDFSPCDGCEPNYIHACSSCRFASPSINESLNYSDEG